MKKMLVLMLMLAALPFSSAVHSQTYCDNELEKLRGFARAAEYELLPQEQKANYFAQLSNDQQLELMALGSGFKLGSALNNSMGGDYRDSIIDVLNRKRAALKSKCGFMMK
jgi:hypothetical protein